MEILLKQFKVIDADSSYHNQVVDIHLKNGIIHQIATQLSPNSEAIQIVHYPNACVSKGWIDVGTQVGDPGYEHREDLNSISLAAQAGGYTTIVPFPNTNPAIHSKSEVQYILANTRHHLVDFHPIGAISQKAEGKQLAEMYDMYSEGAIAFSDGNRPLQHSGLLMRALRYAKSFDGLIINQPHDELIAGTGYMNEGVISTSLGLRGTPSISEEMMVQRDLYLLEYTDSKLHIANVSSAKSVELIRVAKSKGLKVTASVNPMNLVLDDSVLTSFDSNYKVSPPIRTATDRLALIAGLKDGTIDFIQSNHTPQDVEHKNCEFIYAEDGVIMLETAYALCATHLKDDFTTEELIPFFANHTRQILGLPNDAIQEGSKANFTLFDPTAEWTYQQSDIQSKSSNTPFVGATFTGKVLGVVNGKKAMFT